MHGIFQRIGQNSTQRNIRTGKLRSGFDGTFQGEITIGKFCIIQRNDGIEQLVFAVGGKMGVLIFQIRFFDVVERTIYPVFPAKKCG